MLSPHDCETLVISTGDTVTGQRLDHTATEGTITQSHLCGSLSAAQVHHPAYLGSPQGPDDVHQPPFILQSYTVDAVWGHHK